MIEDRLVRGWCRLFYSLPILAAGGLLAAHESWWWLAASVPLTILGDGMARAGHRRDEPPEEEGAA